MSIIREESERHEYRPDTNTNVVIVNQNGHALTRIPMCVMLEEAEYLLAEIKNASKTTFSIERTECFMHRIGCEKIKAPSKDKADIHIVIHDLKLNMQHLLGFSIKSQLGRASTLLNAGETTNFLYKVTGKTLSDGDILSINKIDKHKERMEHIAAMGLKLNFISVDCRTFDSNLRFIDSLMPQYIAECLIVDSSTHASSDIKGIVETIAKLNPLKYTGGNKTEFYAYKMKCLLLSAALGMTPAKEWNGRYDANGGYIVVKQNGDIVCCHFYNRNEVEDYLYENTRLEMASRSRYKFGHVFRGTDGEVYIRLNLQIRFKK